jgi:ATP-binding cassette, subfamily B, bacterial HlyB/CyaB
MPLRYSPGFTMSQQTLRSSLTSWVWVDGELSVGQFVAFNLFAQPRILIFDEATSALDYESESIIQRNMAHICRGRTVIIIAHRLSAVRDAHRIVVMDKGHIVEQGTHAQLLAQPASAYATLWALQQAGRTEDPPQQRPAVAP